VEGRSARHGTPHDTYYPIEALTSQLHSYFTAVIDPYHFRLDLARILYDSLPITRDWRAEAQVRCPTQRTESAQRSCQQSKYTTNE
jgi:hypothetical protein